MNPLKQIGTALIRPVAAVNHALSTPIAQVNPHWVARLLGRRRTLSEVVSERIVLITGASSGIGKAAAIEIGLSGGTVILVARGADKLAEVAAEIDAGGGTAHVYPCDLTDFDSIDAMMAEILDVHGRVDILVNNAGKSIRRSLALSYERFHDFERTMTLNYFAALRIMLAVLPGMRERRFGQIINVSSAGVQTKVPRFGAYIASKAALDTLSDAFQAETEDEGVRFTTVYMSLVRTPMISPTTLYDQFPALTPEEAGEVICDAITARPRRISPAFGRLAAFADSLSPELMDAVRNRGFRIFDDSSAAQGADAPESGDALSSGRKVFRDLTPGVHW